MDTHPAPSLAGIIAEVAAHLLAGGRQLVTAESCTGGWIAKACTDLPGSSRWFRGGAVVYGNELKTALLGVSPGTRSLTSFNDALVTGSLEGGES